LYQILNNVFKINNYGYVVIFFFNIALNTVYGAIFGKFLDPHDESFQEFQKLIKIFFDYLLYLILIGNMFNSNKFMMRLFASRGVNARLKTETIVKQWMINNKNEKKSNDDNTKETVLTRMLEYQSQNYDVVDDDLIISDFYSNDVSCF